MRKTKIQTIETDLSAVSVTQSINLNPPREKKLRADLTIEMIKDLESIKSIYEEAVDEEYKKVERNKKIDDVLDDDPDRI